MNAQEQIRMFYNVQQKRANITRIVLEMLRNNETTPKEIEKLIEKRPEVYGHLQVIADSL